MSRKDPARQMIENALEQGVIKIKKQPNSTEILLHRIYLPLSVSLLVAPFLL